MKWLCVLLSLVFAPLAGISQTGIIQNHCFLGGTAAKTQGLNSTNYLNGIVPSCTITVYLTGTTTKATIYTAGGGPLSNPFTANALGSVNPGGWLFRVATNQGYDVVASGGLPPNTYPAPVTLCEDCYPSSAFTVESGVQEITGVNGYTCTSGSCNISGQATEVQVNGTDTLAQDVINFINGAGASVVNTSAGNIQINADLSGALQMAYTPPVAGAHVFLPATSCSTNYNNSLFASCGNSSGLIVDGPHPPLGGGTASITWTAPTLPSYINPANITAVYVTATVNAGLPPSILSFTCTYSGGGTGGDLRGILYYPTQQTHLMTGVTGANLSTVSCTDSADSGYGSSISGYQQVVQFGYIIYDSVDTLPADNSIPVNLPLSYSSQYGLGMAVFSPNYVYATTVAGLGTASAVNTQLKWVRDGLTLNDCSTGGGSTLVQCQSINGAWTAVTSSGISVSVNGSSVSNPNFNGSSPSPDSSYIANTFKVSGSNVISETPYATPTGFGVVKPDGTSCTVTSGVLTCGGGGGSGTVNSGTAGQIAYYPTTGTAVSGNPRLTDSGTALNYSGTSGIGTTGSTQGAMAFGVGTGTVTTPTATNYVGIIGPATGTPAYFLQLPSTAPSSQCLQFAAPTTVNGVSQAAATWVSCSGGGSFTAGGDLSGSSSSQEVIGILTKPLPSLSSGYLHYNGTAWVFDTPSGTISGLTTGTYPIATSSTGIGNGSIDETTNAGSVTVHKPVVIDSPEQGAAFDGSKTPASGTAGFATVTADSSGKLYQQVGTATRSIICTAANIGTADCPSSGGNAAGFVLLGAYTASTSSNLQMFIRNASGQSGNLFQSDFNVYQVEVVDLTLSTSATLEMQVSTSGSACDTASNYGWVGMYMQATNTSGSMTGSTSAGGIFFRDIAITQSAGTSFDSSIKIYHPLSSNYKRVLADSTFDATNSSTPPARTMITGEYKSSTSIMGVCLLPGSGTISGIVYVYGLLP